MRAQLHHHFKPEFLNRVDDIVVFRPLGTAELRRIVELQLARVVALAADVGVTLDVTDGGASFSRRRGTTRRSGRVRSSVPSSGTCRIPLALFLLEEEVAEGTHGAWST